MDPTAHLWIGALLFYGGHAILASAPVRPSLAARLGEHGFDMVYSTVAASGGDRGFAGGLKGYACYSANSKAPAWSVAAKRRASLRSSAARSGRA